MRRGKQTHAQTRRAINAFQHCASGTLAIGARDVDEAEFVLGPASQRGQMERIFQPELQPKEPQLV
jgi:hypothetical protein